MITRRLHPVATALACLGIVGASYYGGGRLAELRRDNAAAPAPEPASPRFRPNAGRCSPEGECRACSNCSGCGHCAKGGGTCSVCR